MLPNNKGIDSFSSHGLLVSYQCSISFLHKVAFTCTLYSCTCTLSQQDYKVYTMLFNIPRRFLLSPTLIDTPRSSFIHLVPPSASNTPSLMFSPLFRSSFHSNILTTSTLHLHTRNSRKTAHIFLLQNYRSPERSRPQDSLLSSHPRNDPWPASQTTDD